MCLSLTVIAALTAASSFCCAIWAFTSFSNWGDAQVELVLDKSVISLLADEVAVRKKNLAELALMQVIRELVIADPSPMRSASYTMAPWVIMPSAARCIKIRHQRRGDVAFELLLADEPGAAAPLLGR